MATKKPKATKAMLLVLQDLHAGKSWQADGASQARMARNMKYEGLIRQGKNGWEITDAGRVAVDPAYAPPVKSDGSWPF